MREGACWTPVALALLMAIGSACSGDEKAKQFQALEAEREALLASTVPKEEYWAEVARKGKAVKALREVKPVSPEFAARVAQAEALVQAMEPRVVEGRQINDQLAKQVVDVRQSVAQLSDGASKLEIFIGEEDPGEP